MYKSFFVRFIIGCAIQSAAVSYLLYIYYCVYVNPKLLIPNPPPIFPLVTINVSSMSVSLFLSCK